VSTHAEPQSPLRMLQIDPNNASLRNECVNRAIALGEYQQAEQLVDDHLREVPTDPHALFDRATILMACKQYRDAIAQLKALLGSGQPHAGSCSAS
jgi:tetratricopeptide (TPR) repeat protein